MENKNTSNSGDSLGCIFPENVSPYAGHIAFLLYNYLWHSKQHVGHIHGLPQYCHTLSPNAVNFLKEDTTYKILWHRTTVVITCIAIHVMYSSQQQ